MIGVRVKQLRATPEAAGTATAYASPRARRGARCCRVSLVGYTNAGKSTLFNALTRADSYAADQLFATLDTTARRLHLKHGLDTVVSDTVGFIRGLPHQLVEAFKSTLDETAEADLLLHVVDSASSARTEQVAEVNRVLDDIGAGAVPRIIVLQQDRPPRGVSRRSSETPMVASFRFRSARRPARASNSCEMRSQQFAQRARGAVNPESTPAWSNAAVI